MGVSPPPGFGRWSALRQLHRRTTRMWRVNGKLDTSIKTLPCRNPRAGGAQRTIAGQRCCVRAWGPGYSLCAAVDRNRATRVDMCCSIPASGLCCAYDAKDRLQLG